VIMKKPALAALVGLAVASVACDGLLTAEGEGETAEGEGEVAEGEGDTAEGEGDTAEGEGDTAEGEGDTAEGEGEPPPTGWTQLLLTNDPGDFDDDHGGIFGSNADQVTSIYFDSLDRGFVGTIASGVGALYRASASAIEEKMITDEVLGNLPTALGDFGIKSIGKTPTGYIATIDNSGEVLLSTDDGDSFALVATGFDYGLASVELLVQSPTGMTAILSEAVLTSSDLVPSSAALWTELWAPEGSPPTPNPIPQGGCTDRPANRRVDELSAHTYISPDRQLVAYAPRGQYDDEDVLCISHDGGVFFQQVSLPHFNDGANFIGATSILFLDDNVGFVTTSDNNFGDGGSASIQKTVDGGDTWERMPLPALVTGASVEFRTIFFAPGGDVGWALGTRDNESAVVLKTEDGGESWRVAGANNNLNAQLDALPTNFSRLQTGFALDESNIWIGGDHSALFYSANGGD
jgi:photosystem II stability/assembly factor-like uncharacterized protein